MRALIIHASSPDGRASELVEIDARGWQPISLVCLPALRGAARLVHDLDRLGCSFRFDPILEEDRVVSSARSAESSTAAVGSYRGSPRPSVGDGNPPS